MNLGSAPVRYRAKPVQGEPAADQLRAAARSADQGRRCRRRRGAAADLRAAAVGRSARRGRAAASPSSITCSGSTSTRAASPTPGARARPANGRAQAAWVSGLASWRLGDCERRLAPPSSRSPQLAQQRELRAGGLLLGGARRAGLPAGRARSSACCRPRRPRSPGKLLRPGRPRDARHRHQARRPIPFVGFDPPVDQLPNVQRAIELARIGEPALAEELLRHQAKIGAAVRASCADPARQAARPARRAAVARQQRPAGRPVRRRRPLSQPALEPAQRLARRSGARLRPHRPGIGVPPHRGQHGRRGRADAGASGHRRSWSRATAACPTRAPR